MILTEKRKADREKMAAGVTELVTSLGMTVERDASGLDGTVYEGRRVSLELAGPRGVTVGVDFDGKSCQMDVYVLTWNTPLHNKGADRVCFTANFGDMVNKFSRDKSTRIAYGFDHLQQILRTDIAKLNDGSAFDDAFAAEFEARIQRGEMPWQQFRKTAA